MMRLDLELIDAMGGSDIPAAYISDKNSMCLIADINEFPVGYVCTTNDACSWQILDLFVSKTFRKIGIGSCIVGSLKLHTPDDCSLEAYIDNRDAASLGFFSVNQFKPVGTTGELVLMRFGWRFRKAPKPAFRGIKHGVESEDLGSC
jgi:hypothetical protein